MRFSRRLLPLLVVLGLSVASCTDAERAEWGSYGDRAKVSCYSGGQVVFQTMSTGKVMKLDGDGIAFKSEKTDKFVRAFADCIVEQQ